MVAYATQSDVYRYALARGTLGESGRLCQSALASTDEFELDGHGFATNDPLAVRATTAGSLPAPLAAGVTYFAIYVDDSHFKLAATSNGAAIDLTTDGVDVLVAQALPFSDVLEYYSRFVDELLPAHAVPLTPDGTGAYPVVIVALVAELAAAKLQRLAGSTSVNVDAMEIAAKARLERYAAGIPVRAISTGAHTSAAVSSTVVLGGDPRGWGKDGTLP